MVSKGSGGGGGRPEYEQLKECPEAFMVKVPSSDFTDRLKGGEAVSLSVVSEREVKLMVGVFQIGVLSGKYARCVHLGMRYQGRFQRRKTKRGVQAYVELKRIA